MKRILCIDDSKHILEEIVDLLEMEGYQTVKAVKVAEALDNLFNESPDLIITDIQMPVVDGFDFLEKICSLKRFEDTPVIVLSAHADSYAITHAKNLGAKEYLVKPCPAELLIETVAKHLQTIR